MGWGPTRNKRIVSRVPAFICFCFLTADMVWSAASGFPAMPFPVTVDWTLKV